MTILEPNFELEKKLKSGISQINSGVRTLDLCEIDRNKILEIIKKYQAILDAIAEVNRKYEKQLKTIEKALVVDEEKRIKDGHKKSGYTDYVIRAPGSFGSTND